MTKRRAAIATLSGADLDVGSICEHRTLVYPIYLTMGSTNAETMILIMVS
jgi:hypothetical protein